MALTSAEKMQRRRQKLKDEGKLEEYNKKQKELMKAQREKKKKELMELPSRKRMKELAKERKETLKRVQKHRLLKKARGEKSSPQAFRSNSSLGKATSRVKKSLPKSPNKRRVVVKKLFIDYVSPSSTGTKSATPRTNSLSLDTSTIESVQNFFRREDISRQAPGMKDAMVIRDESTGNKEKVQVRHLTASIKEVYALYCSENGKCVGKSKFADLRPKEVKLSNKLPHNCCLCKYHENFIQGVNAFQKNYKCFPKYSADFCEEFLCLPPSENCWLGQCNKCADNLVTRMQNEVSDAEDSNEDVTWHVWEEVNGYLSKVVHHEHVTELINYIQSIYKAFFEHVYIKRQQSHSYNEIRNTVSSNEHSSHEALIQVDFAENYTCIAQNEVQSFHWCQPQVSLFTCSVWFHGKQHPFVIVSDNLTHTKDTIIAYMSRLLNELPSTITDVQIWSDGPSSQFKNKYIAAAIKVLEQVKKIKIQWNYFATSHGKGPVDGIGGAVKRGVRNAVMREKSVVLNSFQFYATAKDVTAVKMILMTDEDINEENLKLNLKTVFEKAPPIKGISKVHVMYYNKTKLMTHILTSHIPPLPSESDGFSSSDEEESSLDLAIENNPKEKSIFSLIYSSDDEESKIDPEKIKHGTFVKVEFPEENYGKTYSYVAICQTSIDSMGDVKVLCLRSTNSSKEIFKVNTDEEEPHVTLQQIKKVLPTPEIVFVGERMFYKFPSKVLVQEKK